MKIEVNNNSVTFNYNNHAVEIHPIWLRERVDNREFLDKKTSQRLFDPSLLENIKIENAVINQNLLEISFNDGVKSNYEISKLTAELMDSENLSNTVNSILWDSLKSFYEYGFVIIKNLPKENNFIIKFANSIGSIRPTNFGKYFNVKSLPRPNDLAYTSLPLSPHTDNPYRKPVPCIQLLHCIENEVSGGYSTLVDGFKVANHLKANNKSFFDILTKIKVKFKFIDKNVVLENDGQLIELDEDKNLKQVRFSTRLDYVPILKKDKLDLYYKARKKISELYNSKEFKIEFKLIPGDLLMMDNHRLLHGRTNYDSNEGKRFLQGCYIDYDSSEGKFRHLKRNFG